MTRAEALAAADEHIRWLRRQGMTPGGDPRLVWRELRELLTAWLEGNAK